MKIILKEPLQIDVSAIAKSLSSFVYRPPFEGTFSYVSSELIRDEAKQVLLFDGKTDKGFTEIYTDYNENQLAAILENIEKSLADKLIDALMKAGIKLISLDNSENTEETKDSNSWCSYFSKAKEEAEDTPLPSIRYSIGGSHIKIPRNFSNAASHEEDEEAKANSPR